MAKEIKYAGEIEIKKLKEFDKNPRKHSVAQINQLAKIIKKYGFTQPLLIDEKNIILAGHGRLMAAKSLDMQSLPCIVISGLSHKDKKTIVINDNKTALNADWDNDLLCNLLQDLNTDGFDMDLTGFGNDELESLFMTSEQDEMDKDTEEDDFDVDEAAKEKSFVKRGEIWLLGKHRMMCGDSANENDIKKLLASKKIDALLTDPPYGINMDKGFSGCGGFNGKGKSIKRNQYKGDWDSERPNQNTLNSLIEIVEKSLIFGGNYFADILPMSTHWVVWDKVQTMPTFSDAELIWTNIDRKSVKILVHEWNGLIGKEKEQRVHPSQKPIALIEKLINAYLPECENILDAFGGSGSTLIACEKLNRICYTMERDENYASVIIKRWENLTGEKAAKESED